jgi:hypothetical protein
MVITLALALTSKAKVKFTHKLTINKIGFINYHNWLISCYAAGGDVLKVKVV